MRTSRACFGHVWGALGQLLGSFGTLLDVFWAPFPRMLGALARIWALMGASGLDFSGLEVPPAWVLESSGRTTRRQQKITESWLGMVYGIQKAGNHSCRLVSSMLLLPRLCPTTLSSHNEFARRFSKTMRLCCREPSMPVTWAFRPPLQRGGTCAVRTWNWLFWPQKNFHASPGIPSKSYPKLSVF